MTKLLCFSILLCLCSPSHASWFDDFFGGGGDKDKTEKTMEATKPTESNTPASTNNTTEMLKTGLSLLPMLMEQLGITESQAGGGLGALLSTAQSLMEVNQFSSLIGAIPNANNLMKAVPPLSDSASSKSSLVSSAMSLAGDNSKTLKAGADLVSQFSSLGLEADMIGKFADVTGDYLMQSDKKEEANSLSSVISGLF